MAVGPGRYGSAEARWFGVLVGGGGQVVAATPLAGPLDGAAVRRWAEEALHRLRGAAPELNRLNVFPVADADTGSNLVATFTEVVAALDPLPGGCDAAAALAATARGALVGAHGNSGTIVSQLLRGLADAAAGRRELGADELVDGLRRGAAMARRAVAAPADGTVLSVAEAAATGAADTLRRLPADAGADPRARIAAVAASAAAGAAAGVARSTDQLPELAAAGVVDAGGEGWRIVLDALADIAAGRPQTLPAPVVVRSPASGGRPASRESGNPDLAFEVQFLVDLADRADLADLAGCADLTAGRDGAVHTQRWQGQRAGDPAEPAEATAAFLRERLAGLGDSVVVVAGDGLLNVHVHTDDIAAVVAAGSRSGRVHRIDVSPFAVVVDPCAEVSIIGLATGAGVREVLQHLGGIAVPAEPDGAFDADALSAALSAATGPAVVLTHAEAAAAAVRRAAAAVRDVRAVAVFAGSSSLHVVEAARTHDPTAGFAGEVAAIAAVSTRLRVGSVIADGDGYLGRVAGCRDIRGGGVPDAVAALVEQLLEPQHSRLTVLTGRGSRGVDLDRVWAAARGRAGLDVRVVGGGQPHPIAEVGVL